MCLFLIRHPHVSLIKVFHQFSSCSDFSQWYKPRFAEVVAFVSKSGFWLVSFGFPGSLLFSYTFRPAGVYDFGLSAFLYTFRPAGAKRLRLRKGCIRNLWRELQCNVRGIKQSQFSAGLSAFLYTFRPAGAKRLRLRKGCIRNL